jgi:hypothetical protein
MTKLQILLSILTFALGTASAQQPDDFAEFKKRAEVADFKARTDRMVDAVGRESCEEFNSQATAHTFFVCLGGARGTTEEMARRALEHDAMLPPIKERNEFVDRALYTHCKRHLDKPFMPDDYSVCKHGVEGAVAIVAKSAAKQGKAPRAK